MYAYYNSRFTNSVIRHFNEKSNDNTQDDYNIPPDFFDIPKTLVLTEITFAPEIKCFQKFHELTNKSYETRIKWITKTVKQLFKPKSRNLHSACVLYERVCVFEKNIH